MTIFTWLLLGHLLGDWILQNDWMAKGKKKRLFTLTGMVHFAIYTATVIGMLWFSSATDRKPAFYMISGMVIFVSHWLIDATDIVERWMRLYRQSQQEVVRVMVDQTLHLLVLVLLVEFGIGV